MAVKINLGAWDSVFVLPTKAVDECLKFADEAKLKVLLYIVRNSGKDLTDEVVSKATGVSGDALADAYDFWTMSGILCKSNNVYQVAPSSESNAVYEEQVQVQTKSAAQSDVKAVNQTTENSDNIAKIATETQAEAQKPKFVVSRPQKPDYVHTAQQLAADEELAFLVNEVQTVFGKTLSNSDASTLLMLKSTCGLPLDVILMLVGYCVSIDKGNMRTLEKIGVSWADDGIYTVEAAENKIRQVRQSNQNYSIVHSAFGIKNSGSPTKKQLEYSDKWVGEWKFSPQMLREAYERCVDTKGQMNFRYIDGILKRWNTEGIKNLNDLQTFDKLKEKGSGSKRNASYNIDELDKFDSLDDF